MWDPTSFMVNTTKLSVLSKSSGEGRGGGLLSCIDSGIHTSTCMGGGTTIFEKLGLIKNKKIKKFLKN